MSRVVFVAVLVAAAIAGFFLQQKHAAETTRDVAADAAQTIDFTIPDLRGEPRSLADWNGKVRLVNFWATWCAPCRKEIPLLKQAQAEHAADNLQVIGVAVDNTEDVLAFAATADFNYPILVGMDEAMAAAEASGVPVVGLPFTLVVAPGGELIKTHLGEIVAEQIEQIVQVAQRLQQGELDLDGAREQLGKF